MWVQRVLFNYFIILKLLHLVIYSILIFCFLTLRFIDYARHTNSFSSICVYFIVFSWYFDWGLDLSIKYFWFTPSFLNIIDQFRLVKYQLSKIDCLTEKLLLLSWLPQIMLINEDMSKSWKGYGFTFTRISSVCS